MPKPTPPEPEPDKPFTPDMTGPRDRWPRPGVCWCPSGTHLAAAVFAYGENRGMCHEHIRETLRRASWGR